MEKLIIFGNGEIADLANIYFRAHTQYDICAHVVDDEFAIEESFNGLPLIALSEMVKNYPPSDYLIHIALSYSKLNENRDQKFNLIKSYGYSFASYISPSAIYIPGTVSFGKNCLILENQTIQPNVKINDNVMIWSGNHIGHGSTISKSTYISSHVVICGHAQVGEKCFIGVNSSIRDFVRVGKECFVGMNCAVTSNLSDQSIVVPSATNQQIYPRDHKISKAILRSFFGIR
ncbi:acetyltransferase [Prochlorococcus sp. MIT 1223]|uniref:acetyltransferase n=1 Tax=Prochlorococcus sp. MIT 1223 TaxID=3096217 RepID=UPI002A766041|nr:acetyltransferase [Prochlorococcus sp. MIT 1223]